MKKNQCGLVSDDESRIQQLEQLLTSIGGLQGNVEHIDRLLRYVLQQICECIDASSAALLEVSDDSPHKVRLGVGNFADPKAWEALLDQYRLEYEHGSPDDSDAPIRIIPSHGFAVAVESQFEITPSRSRLLPLFLQHAAEAIGNSDRQTQRVMDDQLAALGRTLSGYAHDLRGPLGTMRQVVDVLRDGEDIGLSPEKLYEMLDKGVRATNQIIDDCLEYGRGTVKVLVVQGTWNQLLQSPIDSLKHDIDQLGIEFDLDVDESCTLRLDPRLMARVIGNLCKYACENLKRQPDARVTVGAHCDDSATKFWVADNGHGLSPESQQGLFQPFTKKGGQLTGLTLPITKQLVEAHGGTISFETGDSGTRFEITLPRPSPSNATTFGT